MGYHYCCGLCIADGKDKLREDLEKAEKRLNDYYKALASPVGSFRWEEVIHSGDTEESLKEKIRRAREAYQNYKDE